MKKLCHSKRLSYNIYLKVSVRLAGLFYPVCFHFLSILHRFFAYSQSNERKKRSERESMRWRRRLPTTYLYLCSFDVFFFISSLSSNFRSLPSSSSSFAFFYLLAMIFISLCLPTKFVSKKKWEEMNVIALNIEHTMLPLFLLAVLVLLLRLPYFYILSSFTICSFIIF